MMFVFKNHAQNTQYNHFLFIVLLVEPRTEDIAVGTTNRTTQWDHGPTGHNTIQNRVTIDIFG